MFSFLLTNENIPQALAEWMLDKDLGLVGFLLLANLLLLVAGNFMEPSSIILIMAPILYPAAMTLGIDPVHFGILIDVNMEVGLCHPAGRPEPVCGVRHLQAGHHRADQGGDAVAADDARVPGDRHLLAVADAGAATRVGMMQ